VLLNALDVCFQAGYPRFCCVVSPAKNPAPEQLRGTLAGLLAKRPCGFCFDEALSEEQRPIVCEALGDTYRETPEGWFLPGLETHAAEIDQIGCGLAAVSKAGDTLVRATSDFDFYCEHSTEFELLIEHDNA
jgi:hypothetical protein